MSAATEKPPRRVSTRAFAIAAVVVTLVLAGIVSYYASGSPDGLNRVAGDHGFADEEKASATGDSPLADYSAEDVDNDRLSGGLAGVVGVTAVLLLAGGTTYVLRRRGATEESD